MYQRYIWIAYMAKLIFCSPFGSVEHQISLDINTSLSLRLTSILSPGLHLYPCYSVIYSIYIVHTDHNGLRSINRFCY